MNYLIEELIPNSERLIVSPGPEKVLTQKTLVPDKDKNKGKKPDDVHVMKEVINEVKTNYVVGKVIATDPGKDLYKVGDWIIYNIHVGVKLDIFAKEEPDVTCPVMIRYFDVVGKINNEELKQWEIGK